MNRRSLSSRFLPVVFFSQVDPPQGGVTPPVIPPVPQGDKPNIQDAVNAAIANLLGSKSVNGDKDAALEVLIKKNHKLETELEAAQKNVTPDADKTELAAWRAIAAELNFDKPETAKTKFNEAQSKADKLAQREKSDARAAAVKAAGYDPDKFSVLAFADDYAYEVVKETRDGKEVEVAYASREVDGKPERKSVEDVVKERAAAMADVLKASTSSTQSTVTSYPKGAPLGGGQPTTIWDKIREEKKPVADEAPKSWQEQIGLK